jgi:hypothetical protein
LSLKVSIGCQKPRCSNASSLLRRWWPLQGLVTASASGGGSLSLSGSTFTFAPATTYTLPTATPSVLGGVKIDNNGNSYYDNSSQHLNISLLLQEDLV